MKITFQNKKPKYIELFEEIAKLINTGYLKANERLPSKRNLAIDLNVSINTVINAYNLLLDEGFIYSVEKKGYFVVEQLVVAVKHEPIIQKNEKANSILYDLTTQNVDGFTSTNWKKILKEILDSNEYLNKTSNLGDIGLREEIAKHLYNNRGISVSSEQIIIGTGIEMLENIIHCLKIDNVTLENPGYHKLKDIVSNIGLKVSYIGLDEQGCMVPNYKTILYTTPFNQFPTGIKMSIGRKKALIQYAENTNSYIIEDDFDAEFRINSNPTTALFSLSNKRVIFFSTFSTILYPGLRIAYAVLPTDIMEIYQKQFNGYSNPVASLLQLTLKEFINQGHYASHINKRKKLYLKKRELCVKLLRSYNIIVDEKKNYLSLLINVNKPTLDIVDKCYHNGIKIQSLSTFDIDNTEYYQLVLGYTAIPYDKIEDGIKLLIKQIKED